MKDDNMRKFIIVPLLLLVVLVAGTTYALFKKTVDTDKIISIKTGTKYIGIYGPDKENLGLNVTYTFTIENRGTEEASYQVTIEDIINTVGRENINFTYTNGETTKTGKLSDGIIEEENLAPGEKVTVTIRLTSDLSGDYKGKIKVTTGEPVKKNCIADLDSVGEDTSGANPPELVGDMIPVVYNECTKSWVKADTTKSWYNYDNQVWANAVTIKDQTKRAQYVSASAGTEIPIEDMNTMMVWIPRYSYTLGNTYGYQIEGASTPSKSTPGAFDIKFVNKNTTEMGAGKYTGDTPSEYFTPSSFCWGDTCDDEATRKDSGNIELSGIWIAKFELTGTISDMTSLPQKTPLGNHNVSSFFTNIQNNLNGNNGLVNYGLSGNYDAHMIKNIDWGAFAYLSQSKYGKYGNEDFSGIDKKIYINNYGVKGNFLPLGTGCSGGSSTASASNNICQYTYDSGIEGRGASTTGTIYGIYDTIGGAGEVAMGNFGKYTGTNTAYNSGFNGPLESGGTINNGVDFPSNKYYNLYTERNVGIKGDATTADNITEFIDNVFNSSFVQNGSSWFVRSSNYDTGPTNNIGTLFYFRGYYGNPASNYSTRIVVVKW